MSEREPDFLPLSELAKRSGFSRDCLYHSHSQGRGPLAEILTKIPGSARVGAWTRDYNAYIERQRRLADAAVK